MKVCRIDKKINYNVPNRLDKQMLLFEHHEIFSVVPSEICNYDNIKYEKNCTYQLVYPVTKPPECDEVAIEKKECIANYQRVCKNKKDDCDLIQYPIVYNMVNPCPTGNAIFKDQNDYKSTSVNVAAEPLPILHGYVEFKEAKSILGVKSQLNNHTSYTILQ